MTICVFGGLGAGKPHPLKTKTPKTKIGVFYLREITFQHPDGMPKQTSRSLEAKEAKSVTSVVPYLS